MIRRIQRHIVFCLSLFGQQWKYDFQLQNHVRFTLLAASIFIGQIHFAHAQVPGIDAAASIPTTITPQPPVAAPTPTPTVTSATPAANPADKKPDAKPGDAAAVPEKIVNNPFAPGGVTTADQLVTRKEITAMMADQESRLRKELAGQSMSPDELSKLIGNAATPTSSSKPDNFMGCVNGIPLYRQNDGTLDMGTRDPEPIRQERCGNK